MLYYKERFTIDIVKLPIVKRSVPEIFKILFTIGIPNLSTILLVPYRFPWSLGARRTVFSA
jgi:hypothetical protein